MTGNDSMSGNVPNPNHPKNEIVVGPQSSIPPVSATPDPPPVSATKAPATSPSVPAPKLTDRFVPTPPTSLEQTELTENLVGSLVLKYLYSHGVATGSEVSKQVRLPYSIIENVLHSLKNQMLIGYRGAAVGGDFQYELSPKGLNQARTYMEQCTYYGAAPVSVKEYVESIKRQSLRNLNPTFQKVSSALDDLVLNKAIVSQVGQAIRSCKSLFLFGAPGNGKSSIARRLIRAVDESIWIPRTLYVGGEIMRLFDPSLHEEDALQKTSGILKNTQIDERWIRIKRPVIVVGGELSMRHLQAHLNEVTGIVESPLHLKSNCGCIVIDDFGRQQMSMVDLLNRWIVPLECGYDYVGLPSGRQLKVPFDQLVVFSTNLRPRDLCDEAFLRRIPYKVQVFDPTEDQFRELFKRRLAHFGIDGDAKWLDYLIEQHYRKNNRPFRFCHVDDLLSQVKEFCDFHNVPKNLNRENIEIAVNNYFSSI